LIVEIRIAAVAKTTLATWIRERSGRSSWLSLDAGDNDPARFLGYLLLALRNIVPEQC
jgi:LuxR family maltose regulon positive regulatory protein